MFMAQNDLLNVFNLNLNKKTFLQLRKSFNQATSLLCVNRCTFLYGKPRLLVEALNVENKYLLCQFYNHLENLMNRQQKCKRSVEKRNPPRQSSGQRMPHWNREKRKIIVCDIIVFELWFIRLAFSSYMSISCN